MITKEKKREYDRKYHAEHLEEHNERSRKYNAEHREEHNEYQRKYIANNPEKITANSLYKGARDRAKAKGLPFTLTKEWIAVRIEHGICELSGVPFNLKAGRGVSGPTSPSIDRIIPELGYTPENCRVVLQGFNALKSNGTDEMMFFLAEQLTRRNYSK